MMFLNSILDEQMFKIFYLRIINMPICRQHIHIKHYIRVKNILIKSRSVSCFKLTMYKQQPRGFEIHFNIFWNIDFVLLTFFRISNKIVKALS